MSGILSSIISLLTGGIVPVAEALGGGLSKLVTSLFLSGTGEAQTLSVFGQVVIIFAGISLALGLARWVVNFITSLGARNS